MRKLFPFCVKNEEMGEHTRDQNSFLVSQARWISGSKISRSIYRFEERPGKEMRLCAIKYFCIQKHISWTQKDTAQLPIGHAQMKINWLEGTPQSLKSDGPGILQCSLIAFMADSTGAFTVIYCGPRSTKDLSVVRVIRSWRGLRNF